MAHSGKEQESRSSTGLLAILYICAFVASFNENIVNVGLVDIMGTFGVGAATAQWLVTGYMVVSAVVVSIVGFLLNRFSIRQLFFFGSGMLALGSAIDIVAPSFAVLLVARLVQALGTGIFISMMMNTVLAIAPRRKLGTYLAIGSCCITFGPAFGPVVGGVMVTFAGWRSIFAIPALSMVALMVAGAFFVHPIAEPQDAKLDKPSVALSCIGLTALVVGLSTLTSDLATGVVCVVVGLVVIALFARRQEHIPNPVLNLEPVHNPRFAVACIMLVVAMMTTFSLSVLLPLYFEGAAGTSALVAGLLLLIPILFNAFTSLLGGRIMDRWGAWPLLPGGFALIVAGMTTTCLLASSVNLPLIVLATSIVYGGVGFVMSPSQTAGLKQLPGSLHPFGVAIINTLIMVAASIGPSLFVGILSSTAGAQLAASATESAAQAAGFASAAWVAMAIGAFGLATALFYTLVLSRRDAQGPSAAVASAAASDSDATEIASSAGSSAKDRTRHYPAVDGSHFSLEAIMKHDAFVVGSDQPVHEAVEIMLANKTSGLPIVDTRGSVIGFVSDGDIMKSLASRFESDTVLPLTYSMAVFANDIEFDDRLDQLMRSNVMYVATRQVISIDIDTPVDRVCAILGERRIKKAPVLSEGKLVGTVSRADVTRSLMASFLEKKPADA